MGSTSKKMTELKGLVEAAEISLQQAREVLATLMGEETVDLASQAKKMGGISSGDEGQVIEGVFDGQNMVGPDEKKYSVPANYASKSKLVEGDGLKLTITADGSFVYKQINLLERDRLVGKLVVDEQTDEFRVIANGKSYKVLTASITYYKGVPGDSVTILVPKGKETTWAAVENIFKPGEKIADASGPLAEEEGGKEEQTEKFGSEPVEPKPFEGMAELGKKSDEFLAKTKVENSATEEVKSEKGNVLDQPIQEEVQTAGETTPREVATATLQASESSFRGNDIDTPSYATSDVDSAAPDSKSNEPEDIFAKTKDDLTDSSNLTAKNSVQDQGLGLSGDGTFLNNGEVVADDLDKKDEQGLEEL